MQRGLLWLGAWAAATLTAVGVAVMGVHLVAQQVVQPLPATLVEIAGDGPTALGSSDAGTSTPESAPAPTLPADPGVVAVGDGGVEAPDLTPVPDLTATPPASPPAPVGDPPPADPPAPPAAPPAATPSPTATPTVTPTAEPVPTASPATASTAEIRTFQLIGGTVTVEFAPSSVRVLAASPAGGFTRKVEQDSTTKVKVVFESDGHRSRVDAWWGAAGPEREIREDDRD